MSRLLPSRSGRPLTAETRTEQQLGFTGMRTTTRLVELSPDLTTGRVVETITSDLFSVPTTGALHCGAR